MERCIATCERCKMPSDEYVVAASGGMGGDFLTLRHVRSGALYRQNLTTAHYNPQMGAEELKLIQDHAGGASHLCEVPGQLKCKLCGGEYQPVSVSVAAENEMEVFVVVDGTPPNQSLE